MAHRGDVQFQHLERCERAVLLPPNLLHQDVSVAQHVKRVQRVVIGHVLVGPVHAVEEASGRGVRDAEVGQQIRLVKDA